MHPMPWYGWFYLAGLSMLIIYSAFEDLRDGDPLYVIVIDLLEGCAYWIFVVFWYREVLPGWLVVAVPILLVVALLWTVRRARQAFRRISDGQSELTPDEERLAVRFATIAGIVIIAPAYIAGLGLAYRLLP